MLSSFEIMALVLFRGCTFTKTRQEWSYRNTANGKTGTLFSCLGQVSYLHNGNYTEYHGEFIEDPRGHQITLNFNFEGDTTKLKSTVLRKYIEGVYEGWDCAQDWVVLTRTGFSPFCSTCDAWHAD